MIINPFYGTALFQCLLKTSGNFWFYDVFQKVQENISAMKWVKDIFNKYLCRMLIFMLVSITEHAFLQLICTGSFSVLKRYKISMFSELN